MTKTIFCALLLLFLPQGFLAQPDDRMLVAVESPERGTSAALLTAGITVVADMERYLLVIASDEDLAKLEALSLRARILDDNINGKTYYTTAVRNDGVHNRIRTKVRVLRYDGIDAVIEAPPERAERIVAEGVDIARVFLRPIRLAPVEKPVRSVTQADPIIEALVDSVSSVEIDGTVLRLQNFVTRHSTRDSCQSAANYIKARFESFGIDSVYFHHFSDTYKDNVVAVIPGVGDGGQTVVIGGHYDSVTGDYDFCPGADDNASGTAGVLECARVLAKQQFDATIVLVAFCGEEQGLVGSAAFAGEAADRDDNIIAMINMDMIGYVAPGDSIDLDVIDNESSQWLRDLVMDVGGLYVPELSLVDGNLPGGASSDHRSFWTSGFDAILFFEDSGDYSPYIHTANDVVGTSYVSPTLAERSVKVGVALAATLAEPFRVAIRHTPVGNQEDTRNPYRITAEVITTTTLDPNAMFVSYDTGGGIVPVPLVPTGVADMYEAYIPAQPAGTVVDYYLVAHNAGGYQTTHPKGVPDENHRFVVGSVSVILEDDFETDTGWVVGAPDDNAFTGIWVRVDPNGTSQLGKIIQPGDDHTPDPGVMCFVTGNAPPFSSAGAGDIDFGKTTLFSPVYDLSGYSNAWVRYYRWYTNDTGGDIPADEWIVDVSADSGQSWVRLETVPTSRRSWHLVEKHLLEFIPLTSSVQFRFVAADIDPPSIVDASLDDFSIITYVDSTPTTVQPNLPQGAMSLSQNFPNPFNPETRIRLEIGGAGERVTLRIYDAAGRLVTTLLDNEFVVGERIVRWDGRRDGGGRVATGVYFYRLEAGGQTLSRKLAVIR
jgi:hypothetical protein